MWESTERAWIVNWVNCGACRNWAQLYEWLFVLNALILYCVCVCVCVCQTLCHMSVPAQSLCHCAIVQELSRGRLIPHTMYEIYYSFAIVFYISKTLDTANFTFKSPSLFLNWFRWLKYKKSSRSWGWNWAFSIPDHVKEWSLVSLILKGIPLGPSIDFNFHRTTYCILPVFNVSNTDGPKACCCCSTCCGCFITMVSILLFLNVLFCKPDLSF